MNYQIILILFVFFLPGCTMSSQMKSIRKSADQEEFQDLNEEAKFSISFPSPHSGPYKTIDLLNFEIVDGKHKGKNASALLIKPRKTNIWKVLTVMIEENGRWINLKKINLSMSNDSNKKT